MSAVRLGVNTFIWRSPFGTEHDLDLVDLAADLGAETFELAVEDPDLVEARPLAAALHRRGLHPVVCGAYGPGRDVGDPDPAVRASTLAYVARLVRLAEALGADVVAGPAYGSVGLARALPAAERRAEHERVVASLRQAAEDAAAHGVRLALEPLNRFETDRINTVEQGVRLCEEVDHPAVAFTSTRSTNTSRSATAAPRSDRPPRPGASSTSTRARTTAACPAAAKSPGTRWRRRCATSATTATS